MPVDSLDEFFLDPHAVRRSFDAAASTFDSAAGVHAEIRARLLERLDVVRLAPQVVVDLGAATGHATRALKDRYPSARVIGIDLSSRMLLQARRQQGWFRRFDLVAANAAQLPLRTDSANLVFSNLMLQWCSEPDAVLGEIRRVLKPKGLLTFTMPGPDTLREVREAWSAVDRYPHVHRFIDMHDLGDALLRTGFAEPVMDTERLTVTYAGLDPLLLDLSRSGSRNLAHGRPRGLTGRTAGTQFRRACLAQLRDGVLPVTLEVVYGHAWAGQARSRPIAPGEARIPVEHVGRRGIR
jgi:malonyl-CoA O-methyltransferase